MIFVFHGDNQAKLREEFLRLKREYGEASFWEKDLRLLPGYISSPSLFGQKELIAVEDPHLGEVGEIGKLGQRKDVIFLFSRRLTPKDLAKFKGAQIQTFWEDVPKNIFPFLDALGAKERKRALGELHRLTKEGIDLDYLVKMIGWQIRNLARVRSGEVVGIAPYVVAKFRKFAKNWSSEDIKHAFRLLLLQDRRQKSGKKVPFDFLVSRLTERFRHQERI